ncbi:MAG: ABC transporter permease [Halobacteriaceae archaeon]
MDNVKERPWPVIYLGLGALILLLLELGAISNTVLSLKWELISPYIPEIIGSPIGSAMKLLASLPTLLSRDLISNQGYWTGEWWTIQILNIRITGKIWGGTFLGLAPAHAWALRVLAVYLYAFLWFALFWKGFLIYRKYYRPASWTPTDDIINRFRDHQWGQFGLVVVLIFFVMAIFAPTLGTTTVDQNIKRPFSHEIKYYNEKTNSVKSIKVGQANFESVSTGSVQQNIGPLDYDKFGRFHPFGTLPSGEDLFTFMVNGARVTLVVGIISLSLAGMLALIFAVASAYYKGLFDLGVVLTSDSIQSIPPLLFIILVAHVMSGTWIANIYHGGLLIALIFSVTWWPYLWRSIRGPALQVSEEQWIDAAKSFGQRPRFIMQKHMVPYVIGYLLIYGSLTLGGIIIAMAGLSFLGIGINPPTPAWGRAINMGQAYVASASWHISLIPGFTIVLLVTAFNALGDGIRDSIDPQSEASASEMSAAGGGGGA